MSDSITITWTWDEYFEKLADIEDQISDLTGQAIGLDKNMMQSYAKYKVGDHVKFRFKKKTLEGKIEYVCLDSTNRSFAYTIAAEFPSKSKYITLPENNILRKIENETT